MAQARIKLSSPDVKILDSICKDIESAVDRAGLKRSGIIHLPTKRLVVPTRKSPCGGGTETYEKWQMRIHKRFIDIDADERILKKIMRFEMPEKVYIEIELK